MKLLTLAGLGLAVLILMTSLSGCNTLSGMGKDIENAGKHIENAGNQTV